MTERRSKKIRIGRVFLIVAVIVFFAFLAWFQFMQFLGRDTLWKWKVRRQINPQRLRAWSFQVLSNTAPGYSWEMATEMLTNAPSYLVNSERHKPSVVPAVDCVHVIYGGGMYHWGLTIGDTNLPPNRARTHQVETWAPGIYYWNE